MIKLQDKLNGHVVKEFNTAVCKTAIRGCESHRDLIIKTL